MKRYLILIGVVVCMLISASVYARPPAIPPSPPDNTAYNATTWNNNRDAATKDAIRDKIELIDTALTNTGLLVGTNDGSITGLGVATDGQIPIGSTGVTEPVLAIITETGNVLTITNSAGSIDFSVSSKVEALADGAMDPDDIDGDTIDDGKLDQSVIAGFGAHADPLWELQDSDNAAGTAKIYGNSSGGANDIIMYLGVEDSSGESTHYVELDGVTETVDILKPAVFSSSVDVSSGNLEMPNRDATNLTAIGQVAYDTDGWWNSLDSSGTTEMAKHDFNYYSYVIIQPDDAGNTLIPFGLDNKTGTTMYLQRIWVESDVDNSGCTLVRNYYNHRTNSGTTIEGLYATTDGTGVYTQSKAREDIDVNAIGPDYGIYVVHDATDIGNFKITVEYYYDGNID